MCPSVRSFDNQETEQPADEVDVVEDSVQLPSDRYSRVSRD